MTNVNYADKPSLEKRGTGDVLYTVFTSPDHKFGPHSLFSPVTARHAANVPGFVILAFTKIESNLVSQDVVLKSYKTANFSLRKVGVFNYRYSRLVLAFIQFNSYPYFEANRYFRAAL